MSSITRREFVRSTVLAVAAAKLRKHTVAKNCPETRRGRRPLARRIST
jgi:hypothetical protein